MMNSEPNGGVEDIEPNGQETHQEDEQPAEPLLEELPLQELINMIREEASKKFDEEEEETFTNRFNQLTKITGEIVTLDPKSHEPTAIKKLLGVKIEELRLVTNHESAVKRWRQLIEDLDDELRIRRGKISKKEEVRQKVKELKEKGEKIPLEFTKKGHAKKAKEIENTRIQIIKLRKKVDSCQKREMSLEDMGNDNSVYLKEDRYLKRLNTQIKKLARLEGYQRKDHRPLFRPIKYTQSKYDDINEAVSKQVSKLVKEKRLDSGTKKRGVAPDFKDILDIVSSTNSGKSMTEVQINNESQDIFKNIIGELRERRSQETSEFFDQYESDEELGTKDVHELEDEELKKKLTPLDQINQSLSKVVQEFVTKVENMTEEERKKDEEEAVQQEQKDEAALLQQDENELDDEDDEEEEDLDEESEDMSASGELSQDNNEEEAKNQEDSEDDSDEDELHESGDDKVVDLSSDEDQNDPIQLTDSGPSNCEADILLDQPDFNAPSERVGEQLNSAKHGHEAGRGDSRSESPAMKKMKTVEDVEEITLSSDEEN